ncbi:zwei Ig domain protein zig-8 isoform X1 [Apis mellifera carnica]|nr:zwei Ig domain protein zig-8 isoform X1 [Apis mellifera carnica]
MEKLIVEVRNKVTYKITYWSQAEHQQSSSANNEVAKSSAGEDKGEDVIEGPIREVLAQSGSTANLPCKITEPGAGTVNVITWMKRKNRRLLTVGKSTHSVDKRFVVIHSSTDWLLQIRVVTVQDEGIYECQITSHPVQRNFVRLKITEAYSIIPGAPDLHVKQGSSLRLECQLKAAAESPLYVFWYRQGHMINYDEEPGVKVELTKNGSILMVNKTKPSHGGNYTCAPSNAKPAYVMVHVIEEEEKPAAMHGGDRRNLGPAILASNFLVSLLAAVSWRIPSFTSLYPT